MSNAGFNGGKVMREILRRIPKNGPEEFARAQKIETDVETREARRRTPVDKGDLRETVRTEGPEIVNGRIRTAVVAGSEAVSYAAIVHEDLEAFHSVGQAKYIESVLMESQPYMAGRIARRVNLNNIIRAK